MAPQSSDLSHVERKFSPALPHVFAGEGDYHPLIRTNHISSRSTFHISRCAHLMAETRKINQPRRIYCFGRRERCAERVWTQFPKNVFFVARHLPNMSWTLDSSLSLWEKGDFWKAQQVYSADFGDKFFLSLRTHSKFGRLKFHLYTFFLVKPS